MKSVNPSKWKKLLLVLFSITAVILISYRIYYTNATAVQLPSVERYFMNEWVDLNGAFLNTSTENTQGYSMRVTKAELLSYNGYIVKYGIDKDRKIDGLDELSLICLEIEIRNVGNEDGRILIFECKLIPDRKNTYFIPSTALWAESESTLPKDGSIRVLAIKKDSEYTVHIPYKINVKDLENYTEYKKPMRDTSFELVISNSPVRKVIVIEL